MKIIARYKEDIPTQENSFVVQKDVHLPNEGREASSYLWYIIENYDKLEGIYQFRQAKEHEHPVAKFELKCNLNGDPHHSGVPVGKVANMIDLEIPAWVEFSPGAQFDVSAEIIKKRSLDWYKKAYEVSMTEPQAAWALERLWKYIFEL